MEESYIRIWDDLDVQNEEVISSIDDDSTIIPADFTEFTSVHEEIVVQENHDNEIEEFNEETQSPAEVMYVTEDNMMVIQQPIEIPFEISTEEVVIGPWSENCLETDVGPEEHVEVHPANDMHIPLPTDQGQYTAERLYPSCPRKFKEKTNLINHTVVHRTERPYGCNLCDARYKRKCNLMNHLKIHACMPDTDGNDDDDLQIMDDSDADKLYQPSSTSFMKKRQNRIKTKDDRLASSSRSYNYMNEDVRLIEAMENNPPGSSGSMNQDFHLDDEDHSDDDTKFDDFFCPTCGLLFHRRDNMKRHQRIHINEEITKETGFSHVCNVCSKSFDKASELLDHVKVHAKGWKHRCVICGEVFVDDQQAEAHVQAKHAKDLTRNTCKKCGCTFKSHRGFATHVDFQHSNRKLFCCSKCDQNFPIESRLRRHMLTHRNKVVSCKGCDEKFSDVRSLKNHRCSHSSVSGQNFSCSECGKTFAVKSYMLLHMRSHTREKPYGCSFCWKSFADGGTWRKHERTHTGEKPYTCVVCQHAFNQRVLLRDHIKHHHSKPDPNHSQSMTPYACAVCSSGLFVTPQDLIAHLVQHCDLNKATRKQSQVAPRRYKRRRKLEPHELEMMSTRNDDDLASKLDPKQKYKRKITKHMEDSKLNKIQKKIKTKPQAISSRLNMIKTQKPQVPIETKDGSKVRHKTKTLVTHTQPKKLKSVTGERIHLHTKDNFQSEKFLVATFPEGHTEQAVNNNLLVNDTALQNNDLTNNCNESQSNDIVDLPPDIASEQTIESDSLSSGRTIIEPGSKVVKLLRSRTILSNAEPEPVNITSDIIPGVSNEEIAAHEIIDSSCLHKLTESSIQRVKVELVCEICGETFSNCHQLVEHVCVRR